MSCAVGLRNHRAFDAGVAAGTETRRAKC